MREPCESHLSGKGADGRGRELRNTQCELRVSTLLLAGTVQVSVGHARDAGTHRIHAPSWSSRAVGECVRGVGKLYLNRVGTLVEAARESRGLLDLLVGKREP